MLARIEKFKTKDDWENNQKEIRTPSARNSFREEIKKIGDKERAIKTIATIDGLATLPILLDILEGLKKTTLIDTAKLIQAIETMTGITRTDALDLDQFTTFLNDQSGKLYPSNIPLLSMVTEFFPHYAFYLFTEIDKRQLAGKWEIIGLMLPYKAKKFPNEALKNPFICQQHLATLFLPEQEQLSLWEEMALWLEGMHERAFNDLPELSRDKEGNVVKLPDGSYPLTGGIRKEQDADFKSHFNLTFYDMAYLYLQTAKHLEANFVKVSSEKKEVKKKKPALTVDAFDRVSQGDDDSKINYAIDYLEEHELNEDQLRLLKKSSDSIRAGLNSYVKKPTSTYGIPTLFRSRPFKTEFSNSIRTFDAALGDVVKQAQVVFNLWKQLVGEGSYEGKEITRNLLLSIFNTLRNGAEEKQVSRPGNSKN